MKTFDSRRVRNPAYTSTSSLTCKHALGDDSTLVVAADRCSLECKVCHKVVLEVEMQAIVFSPPTGALELTLTGDSRSETDNG